MNKLVWRLSKLPTPDELVSLVNNKLLTQEEAKEILFKSESTEDRDEESLKAEIKFLRELVEKLANSPTKIIETIKYIDKPLYYTQPWYEPYKFYCGSGTTTNNAVALSGLATNTVNCAFSSIKTF